MNYNINKFINFNPFKPYITNYVNWCSTCGVTIDFGLSTCEYCLQWWILNVSGE